jgi:hypothetical protein
MKDIEKNIEYSEIKEDIEAENTVETSGKTTEDCGEEWFEKAGETTLVDAIKIALQYAGNLKLKYIALVVGGVLMLYLCVLLIYYVLFPLLIGVLKLIAFDFLITIGEHKDGYCYRFFDNDLFSTVPLCVAVSIIANNYSKAKGWLFWLIYFVVLLTSLEGLDYCFIETRDTNAVLGGTCFVLLFIIVPVLLAIKSKIDVPECSENVETDTKNI